ncbi:hypothetical protein BKA19_1398 [Blastococcus saxobsidens]|uniref:CopC domain-containing protein n=1 Tax=Blastococcus saxobsidens TaxID=138336 RepID=A0A4Q7Y4G7_9ACTN|nr:hypothetical protein BKA19_1398 [Blastococcus saxobsidens]
MGQALLGMAATALIVGTGPSVALAHDGLVSTTPAPAETVSTAPSAVELRFTGEPLPLGTQVLVSGPDGAPVSEGPAEIRDTAVVQPVRDALPAGAYRVEWRSTSSDGHPLSGTYDFTVTEAAASAPASAPAAAAEPVLEPARADAPQDAGLPAVYPLAGVGLLGALGVLTARRLRRRS